VFEISLAERLASHFPKLKKNLGIAHLPQTPVQFISRNLKVTFLYSILLTILFIFVMQKAELPMLLIIPVFMTVYCLFFGYGIIGIKAKIRKRQHEIDREVLFVGRYLLIKLYSGRPLLSALMETSNSRGVAAKYIKEIVDDIGTGKNIEEALSNALTYAPSERLRKILFHVNNALQLGIDVTKPLESVLEEITNEEELEINKYGKKLNTLVIFYMLVAVIAPSLGVAIFMIIASFINFPITLSALLVLIFFIIVVEFIFITLFKSIRPMVSL